jgi:lipoprotein-anchoring transpeptidase ErfK/SrfK
MMYNNGGPAIVGFAPWASRFTNGAFLHGVPVNNPGGAIVEYSQTLGTIPRSHECVRNASSHAKFIYDWAPLNASLVFVYD